MQLNLIDKEVILIQTRLCISLPECTNQATQLLFTELLIAGWGVVPGGRLIGL